MSKRTRTRAGHNPTNEKLRRQKRMRCWEDGSEYAKKWRKYKSNVYSYYAAPFMFNLGQLRSLVKAIPGVTKVSIHVVESNKVQEEDVFTAPLNRTQPEKITLDISGIRGTRGRCSLIESVVRSVGWILGVVTPNTKLTVVSRFGSQRLKFSQ